MHQRPTGPGIDPKAPTHQYADMRTTIDLPDELYRTLKTRAAIKGVTLRELVQGLIEQGLRQPAASAESFKAGEPPLPVAIPATGTPIRAFTNQELHELEMEDDRERFARST